MACKNRKVAATRLNSCSSRSHAILRLTVEREEKLRKLVGKLNLIDLAGSEDNRQTNNSGERMMESNSINSSLLALGKVVEALNKGYNSIPYRDSQLTRILQDSLGGTSHSVLIANVAPCQKYWDKTLQTLNFASKSRLVINNPIIQEERRDIDDNNNRPLDKTVSDLHKIATITTRSKPSLDIKYHSYYSSVIHGWINTVNSQLLDELDDKSSRPLKNDADLDFKSTESHYMSEMDSAVRDYLCPKTKNSDNIVNNFFKDPIFVNGQKDRRRTISG